MANPLAEPLKGVCLVFGAGDAIGGAIAQRFAQEGLDVAVARRSEAKLAELVHAIQAAGGRAKAYACDARVEEQVTSVVSQIESELGPITVCIHNIGANVRFLVKDTTCRKYRKVWEMAALSAFLTAREVTTRMVTRRQGTMIFTGATASIRGASGFAAFSGAMHAKRALAQSLAREVGRKGIHVAHVVIDGPVDTAFVRGLLGEDEFQVRKARGSLIAPEAIADCYWRIHNQPRTAWTHELDIRPWDEGIASRM